jgi:drug/metabolite transporter (DMT)-like permease
MHARTKETPLVAEARVGIPVAVRACLWMGGALVSFTLMAVAVRELAPVMSPYQILFLRSVVALLLLLLVLPRFGARALRTRRLGLHVARNVLHFAGQYSWVYAIGLLPLATVFAIEFTMPVWTAVLAALILGERLNRGRVVMLLMGFAGIIIILRPGFEQVSPAALVMLAGAFAYASTMIATKRIAGYDGAFALVFYMSAIQLPLGLVLALPEWTAPRAADWPWIIAVGATGLTAHLCLQRALRIADATLVVPIDFLRLPLIAAVGVLCYGEPLELPILLGAAVIFAGTYYSIRRESRG